MQHARQRGLPLFDSGEGNDEEHIFKIIKWNWTWTKKSGNFAFLVRH